MVWRKMVAEFIGTFTLVFVGCGAIISQGVLGGIKVTAGIMEINPFSYLTIALAFGLTVMVVVYAIGNVSAAHINPAVTIGFAVAGRFPWRYVPHYLVAQFAGALFGSVVHYALFSGEAFNVNFGATMLGPELPHLFGLITELVLTFLLMFAYMASMADRRFPSAASGLTIGLTVTVCILMGGVWTGSSMNPARSLATALFAYRVEPKALSQIWIYLLAPVIGAIVAALVYEFLRPTEFAKSAPEDLVQEVQAGE
jgi:MIP family channel proteins